MPRQPSYCHHKPTGQAYVRIDGKIRYLGKFDSPGSRDQFDKLILQWKRRHDRTGMHSTTVGQLVAAFITSHAETYYRHDDGTPTTEVNNFRLAVKPLVKLFRGIPVVEFGPQKLAAVRDAMIGNGYVRRSINRHVFRIRKIFRWGVSQELVPPGVLTALDALDSLRAGRSGAAESDPVLPVPQADIDAALPRLTPPVRAMVEFQLLTGARPSEVRIMKAGDVDRSGDVWTYSPGRHKTKHHGKGRMIFIGPKAQELLLPFLLRPADAFVFSPIEGRGAFVASKYRDGAVVSVRNAGQGRKPYSLHGYTSSIRHACKAAGVPVWTPGRLRHNAATVIRQKCGDIDAARVVLGHSEASTTTIYAERDLEAAREIMRQVG